MFSSLFTDCGHLLCWVLKLRWIGATQLFLDPSPSKYLKWPPPFFLLWSFLFCHLFDSSNTSSNIKYHLPANIWFGHPLFSLKVFLFCHIFYGSNTSSNIKYHLSANIWSGHPLFPLKILLLCHLFDKSNTSSNIKYHLPSNIWRGQPFFLPFWQILYLIKYKMWQIFSFCHSTHSFSWVW